MTDRRHPSKERAARFGVMRRKKLRCDGCGDFICWYDPTVEQPNRPVACKRCAKIAERVAK